MECQLDERDIAVTESLCEARDVDDRTVHGLTIGGKEIVRYNRAGKWCVEGGGIRQSLTVNEAARLAAIGNFSPGLPGGNLFDARVRKFRAEMDGAM